MQETAQSMVIIGKMVSDTILILGVGTILTQIFKAADTPYYATMMKVATWTCFAVPCMELLVTLSRNGILKNIIMGVAAFVAGFLSLLFG